MNESFNILSLAKTPDPTIIGIQLFIVYLENLLYACQFQAQKLTYQITIKYGGLITGLYTYAGTR